MTDTSPPPFVFYPGTAPLLVSMPAYWDKLILLMVIKVVYAVFVGFLLDFVLRKALPRSLRGGGLTGPPRAARCFPFPHHRVAWTATPGQTGTEPMSDNPWSRGAVIYQIYPRSFPDTGGAGVAEADLIIEAIAERLDWKQDLYKKIAPFVADHAVLASNTSGLGINALSDVLPEQLRHRFCGVHFFNPPRYMHLAELIPTKVTDTAVLEGLEGFLVTTLGKGVVYAKDTPNFIGNRIGVFSILASIHHTAEFGLGFDEVDAVSGPLIGRPKSATYRTSDVVGLDTMAHVIKTMRDTLPNDPWHKYFAAPKWLEALIAKGALGQKTGAGIFRKVGKDIMVLDLKAQDYRPATGVAAPEVVEILKLKNPAEKFARLRESEHPQAQFLWATFRDLFHYSAYHLADIAETARDVDFAMRWGFGMAQGPFELWQEAGWLEVAKMVQEDIDAGKTLAKTALPKWVFEGPVAEAGGVHTAQGSWSASQQKFIARRELPVYQRQIFPEKLLGEDNLPDGRTAGTTGG